ncbi:unnamed protein product [Rotaria socialis]|uniref:Uncharacterized protein n=1 Tax=Rotaria socialis TaxID=392032 RepID=A0A817PGY2_9BILA|nr:unnamed protein product [Rotaria socialis]
MYGNCLEFTFDTEGERSNNQLALIQIQTIPQQLPCFVVLLELLHLPSYDTLIFVKIKQLFQLIFQSKSKLYSWGPLRRELYPVVNYELWEWPIASQIFDIQLDFSEWLKWALFHCKVCSSSLLQHNVINDVRSNTNISSSSTCTCHEANPYRSGEKWKLQDALIYTCQWFIDKSMTSSYWAKGLDPHHSSLSTTTREKMLRYAIYDCFTTTYLARPVLRSWTFQKVKKFISEDNDDDVTITQCRTIPVTNVLYAQISDDKICISQMFSPVTKTQPELEDVSDDEQQQQHQLSVAQHSPHARRLDERRR